MGGSEPSHGHLHVVDDDERPVLHGVVDEGGPGTTVQGGGDMVVVAERLLPEAQKRPPGTRARESMKFGLIARPRSGAPCRRRCGDLAQPDHVRFFSAISRRIVSYPATSDADVLRAGVTERERGPAASTEAASCTCPASAGGEAGAQRGQRVCRRRSRPGRSRRRSRLALGRPEPPACRSRGGGGDAPPPRSGRAWRARAGLAAVAARSVTTAGQAAYTLHPVGRSMGMPGRGGPGSTWPGVP